MDERVDLTSASPPALNIVSETRLAAVIARTAAFVCVSGFALALASGCSNAPAPGTPVRQTIALATGQSYKLDDGAQVRFANVVNDSRCPIGATCVWAGTATVNLGFRPAGSSGELEILTVLPGGVSPEDIASLLPVDTLGYRVTLVRLEPAPRADGKGGAEGVPARATFKIEKPISR